MCEELNLTFLGAIPLDPMIARSCDEGKSYIEQCPESMASKAYKDIFESKLQYWSIQLADLIYFLYQRLYRLQKHKNRRLM